MTVPVLYSVVTGLLAGCCPCQKGTCDRVVLADAGKSEYRLVVGTNRLDRLAADELIEIFEKGTGVKLSETGTRPLYVGRCAEAEAALGKARLDALRDEETLVAARDGAFFLIGGGDLGTLYAVYDFVEKCFGYKLYGLYPEAEIVNRVSTLTWDGKDVSTCPKFDFYRTDFGYPTSPVGLTAKFMLRNRNDECFTRYGKNVVDYMPKNYRALGAQHGSYNFVPPNDARALSWEDLMTRRAWYARPFQKGVFKEHPEYYSLDEHGKRVTGKQVCFSNPDLRRLFTERFREVANLNGPGLYCVGQNDLGNDIYCYCDGCQKLVAKYRTNAGPQWDYILELCEAIRDLPGVRVLSLAYKRNEQSEIAPMGIVFPDNFVCDMGCLNAERPPSRMPDITCADGRIFNRSANIAEWMKILKTPMTYWYYSAPTPAQTYRRMQEELREVYADGMRGIGACGTGGGVEFSDVSDYMFFRLARDPDLDADKEVRAIFAHKYGPAADMMFDYLKELEEATAEKLAKSVNQAWGTEDSYDAMSHLEAKDIVRWQGMFDRMERLAAGSPRHLRNVKIARLGPDCWTIVFAPRLRAEVPDYAVDAPAILKRGLAACEAAEAAGMVSQKHNNARRVLEGFRYYASLKSSALPPELANEDPKKVLLYLPTDVRKTFPKTLGPVEDQLAAAGIANAAPWTAEDAKTGKIGFSLYDIQMKEWVMSAAKDSIPLAKVPSDRYALVKAGTGRLPKRCIFVSGGKWGTGLDIRDLGRYFDPSYDDRIYDYYVSLRLVDGQLRYDRLYLVLRSKL